ncbi:uncharacterized protein ACIBXB_022015 isoform 1-T2 [Morphnus guianensis]
MPGLTGRAARRTSLVPSTAVSGLARPSEARPPAPASPVQPSYRKTEQIGQETNRSRQLSCSEALLPLPGSSQVKPSEAVGSPPRDEGHLAPGLPPGLPRSPASSPVSAGPLEGGTATHNAGRIPAFV